MVFTLDVPETDAMILHLVKYCAGKASAGLHSDVKVIAQARPLSANVERDRVDWRNY